MCWGTSDGLKGCAARTGKPASALDPATRAPAQGNGAVSLRPRPPPHVTFLSGRNRDFSNGHRHGWIFCHNVTQAHEVCQSEIEFRFHNVVLHPNEDEPAATSSSNRHSGMSAEGDVISTLRSGFLSAPLGRTEKSRALARSPQNRQSSRPRGDGARMKIRSPIAQFLSGIPIRSPLPTINFPLINRLVATTSL